MTSHMMDSYSVIPTATLQINIVLQVWMWVPNYRKRSVLKNHIQIIFKPKLFPFPWTTHQTYTLSTNLPHLESTKYLHTYCMSKILLNHPKNSSSLQYKYLPSLIKNSANTTILILIMINTNHDNPVHDTNFNWYFKPRPSKNNATIPIQDFHHNEYSLINKNQFLQRHPTVTKIITEKG